MSPTSCHCSTPHRGVDYTTRTRDRQGIAFSHHGFFKDTVGLLECV
jgi:hypothetical protein